jgi:protein-L-isoaspartate O-methyltransferase
VSIVDAAVAPATSAALTALTDSLAYDVDDARLGRELATRFRRFAPDDRTVEFLRRQHAERHGRARWLVHALLRTVVSDFTVNGMLGTYRLHLLSSGQWGELLGSGSLGRLLDVGAGVGDVTKALAAHADEVLAIETTAPLVRRLVEAGIAAQLLDIADANAAVPNAPYDTIALLNVADRCAKPRTILRRLRESMASDGRLIVSMPLPYSPMYYRGPRRFDPDEPLPIGRGSWESQARALVDDVLVPMDLRVEALTRVPYLSEGDRTVPFYALDAVVVVCRAGRTSRASRVGRANRATGSNGPVSAKSPGGALDRTDR